MDLYVILDLEKNIICYIYLGKAKRKVYLLNFSIFFFINIGIALAGLVTFVLVGLEKFHEI